MRKWKVYLSVQRKMTKIQKKLAVMCRRRTGSNGDSNFWSMKINIKGKPGSLKIDNIHVYET